jgi:hypothetical protein
MTDPQPGKLIIDSDWKAQAQAEKERLAAAERAKQSGKPEAKAPGAAPTPGSPDEGMPAEGEMPQADFVELCRMLASQALLYLGAMPDPETGRRLVSLEMAQFNIDLISMLEQKTKNNLSEQEQTFLTRVLYELRMQYVEIGKAVAKAVEQGRIAPGGGMVGGPGSPGIVTPGAIPPINIKGQ